MPDIPPHIRAMFEALRFNVEPEALPTISDAEWKDLLSRWDTVRFTVPLRQAHGDALPAWARTQIDEDTAKNEKRFERIKKEYSVVACALRDAGAEHLVLKGFAQWPGYVDHPSLRRQSDIDIYCPPDSIKRAREALGELGYQPTDWVEPGPSDHLAPLIRKSNWKWRGDFYDPEMPIAVELHFRLWDQENSHVGPSDLEGFWFRRVERKLDDLSFPSLSPVDGLGYFSLHILRDLLRGVLRSYNLYELARFLHTRADDERFWQDWLALHDASLRSLQAIPFRFAHHLDACTLPAEVKTEVDALSVPVKAWFERFADSPLNSEFHPNKDLLWLHIGLLESPRDKREVLLRRLLPPRITRVDAPYIEDSPEARDRIAHSPVRKRWRHVTYLASRAIYHARILPPTLWRGARWWLSTKEISGGFWTFFAACFFFDFGMYVYFLLYNLYLVDRGFREDFLGLLTGATSLGSIAGSIPAGILAQRLGLRKTLLLCLTLVPSIFALRSLIGAQTPLIVLSFLGGAAVTIWAVGLSPAIAQLTSPRSRTFGFSVVFSSGIGVGILGGQMGGHLPGWLSHTGPFASALHAKQAALLFACSTMALSLWPLSRLHFVSAPAPEKKSYSRNPFLIRYLIVIAVWSFAVGAFSPFFNVYFSQHLGMAVKQIGTVYSFSHVSQLVAMLVAPIILRKFGLVSGIMYTQIVAAMALGCLAAAPGTSSAAIIYIGYVAFQWMAEPGMFSLLMNQVTPSEQTGASAMNFLVINIAQAIAATAAGASFVKFGYPAVLGVTAAIGLVAACMFRLLLGKDPVPVSQTSPAEAGS